ncbi:hypothetical protein HPB49_001687 [Dermacentor silvarum]|uniref:Uncharacterized protein n=1 Tax=Dermacentor silvarum TaxID=543639 RepID=A0ACB8CJ17_DERSI|nr:hypothetical protein HPB49_001687 [Dermacentor silvarum]
MMLSAMYCCTKKKLMTLNFHKNKHKLDSLHDELLLSFMHSQSSAGDLGFRDDNYFEDVLEKQSDMIRYLKKYNAFLGRKILNLSVELNNFSDELPSADVSFDDLRAAGVSIPTGITFEGFADADKDLELCAELTDDEIIRQVTEDSDDSDTENEEPAPTQPTSSELTRALMTLSSVYSGNMTLTEIEADMIAGKRTVQKKINDFFAPKC